MVETFIPKSKEEALRFLNNRKCTILAGGTDLIVKTKKWSEGLNEFNCDVILIKHLKELKNIKIDEKYISIGSACTLTELETNILIPKYFKEVILSIGSPAIRNVATIGGNICNELEAGDIFPLLYALDAILVVESLNEIREIELVNFMLEPGKKDLKAQELLVEIRIPINNSMLFYYKKVGTRKSTALAKASFVGFYFLEHTRIVDVKMAFVAASSRTVRSRELEDRVKGLNKKELESVIGNIKEEYFKSIIPISKDEKSITDYRKCVCLNLMGEFFDIIFRGDLNTD